MSSDINQPNPEKNYKVIPFFSSEILRDSYIIEDYLILSVLLTMNKRGISKERALGLLQELFNKSGEPDSVNSDIKELQDLTPGIIVSGNIQYGIGGIQAAIAINFDDPIISDKVNNFDINKVPNNVTLNSNTLDINRDYGAANETVKRVKDFVEQLAKE